MCYEVVVEVEVLRGHALDLAADGFERSGAGGAGVTVAGFALQGDDYVALSGDGAADCCLPRHSRFLRVGVGDACHHGTLDCAGLFVACPDAQAPGHLSGEIAGGAVVVGMPEVVGVVWLALFTDGLAVRVRGCSRR